MLWVKIQGIASFFMELDIYLFNKQAYKGEGMPQQKRKT